MLSIRFMLGAAVGAAGGYVFGRAVEARAHGVSLTDAFSLDNIFKPIMKLPLRRQTLPSDPWANLSPQQRETLLNPANDERLRAISLRPA